ncbi:MAG: glutathione S-transferase C-terminal domain-containing protein [Paracoccaceae bacterium]
MTALLYHCPLNCSLAVRIAANEGGVPLELDWVEFDSKHLSSGGSLLDVNPLGQVSTMQLPSGELLTETSACLMWVQAQSNNSFRVDPDDPAYFQMLRWLGFTATELHKQALRVVFYPEATDAVKDRFRALVPARFTLLDSVLADRKHLLGDRFSAADAYLTWFFVLAERAGLLFPGYTNLEEYCERVLARQSVRDLIAEDLARRG